MGSAGSDAAAGFAAARQQGGCPIVLIDWDFAAPGPRNWDVGYALWRFVPL